MLTGEQDNRKKVSEEDISAEYKARGDHAGEVCRDYHEEISARYDDVWPGTEYQDMGTKASVFLNRDAWFLWCRVPRAASQSLITIFMNQW